MKILYFIILTCVSLPAFANIKFESDVYELEFVSENINLTKEEKINQIKILTFNQIFSQLLTNEDFNKIKTDDINFIDKFILNIKINNEKIVNKNYFSKVLVNYNKEIIFNYLIKNKYKYVDKKPDNFLMIIKEKNNLKNYLLSEENKFYKYLKNTKNLSEYFIIPNLDYNDRFLLHEYNFENFDNLEKNIQLNQKYNSHNQILINSTKKNNYYINDIYLYDNSKKYFITRLKLKEMNFENFFQIVLFESINKWKEVNLVDTTIVSKLNCIIKINNIYELSYVRNLLNKNKIIKDIELNSIKLNQNSYTILYFGNKKILENSLESNRLKIFYTQNQCNIKLV
tara:strand:- start:771 stop:1796 length:1026 start_codon:yes stop_codon:yes gene_type:complete